MPYILFALLCLFPASSAWAGRYSPIGSADSVENGLVKGWVLDRDQPGASIQVHAFFNGPAGVGFPVIETANKLRPDVNAAFGTTGNHGFEIPIPEQFKTGQSVTVYLYGVDLQDPSALLTGPQGNFMTFSIQPRRKAPQVGMFYLLHHAFAWSRSSYNREPGTVEIPVPSLAKIIKDGLWFGAILPLPETYRVTMTTPVDENRNPEHYCFFEQDDFGPWANSSAARNSMVRNVCSRSTMRRVAERHARLLREAGVDFILIDNSNNPMDDRLTGEYGGEVTILRPMEVFLSYWSQIPNAPKVAVFGSASNSSNAYFPRMLAKIYDKYPNQMYRVDGKAVFFYADKIVLGSGELPAHSGVLNQIASHGITPVPMWTHFGANGFDGSANYKWDFISPCLYRDSQGVTRATTTSVIDPNQKCSQYVTQNSPLGSVVTVGPSFQVPGYFASENLGSSGRYGVLTLQKQFDTVFEKRPDTVLVKAWNEHSAGPGYNARAGKVIGAGSSPADNSFPSGDSRYAHYVDTYAAEFSSDIEPTLEYGDLAYGVLKDLIRAYKAGESHCDRAKYPLGCTQYYDFVPIWALAQDTGRFVYTASAAEKAILENQNYRPICVTTGEQNTFCKNSAEARASQGPFIAYNKSRWNRSSSGLVPIYRCYNGNGLNYWLTRNSAECSLASAFRMDPAEPLFYVSKDPSYEMLRPLRRCYGPNYHSVAVDAQCPSNTRDEGILGYVH